jgi:hypothetical protein
MSMKVLRRREMPRSSELTSAPSPEKVFSIRRATWRVVPAGEQYAMKVFMGINPPLRCRCHWRYRNGCIAQLTSFTMAFSLESLHQLNCPMGWSDSLRSIGFAGSAEFFYLQGKDALIRGERICILKLDTPKLEAESQQKVSKGVNHMRLRFSSGGKVQLKINA